MTLKQALERARGALLARGIDDVPLECQLLLRQASGISRVQLYLNLDRELSSEEEAGFWCLVGRRLSGEPIAYIRGHREFYGLDFSVEPGVLIPRPESELLVEQAIKLAEDGAVSAVAEVGTGCGAVAISLALHLPRAKIYATDISASALKIARFNCEKHRVADMVCLLQGDMLHPLPEPVDIIIANLPYVREAELSQVGSAGFEPLLALNGGLDGLDKIRQLCGQAGDRLRPWGSLLLEIGQGQATAVTALLSRLFPSAEIEVMPDLSGIGRVVRATLTAVSESSLASAAS
jgi:release factor glutamine methyltransferase